MTSFKLYRHKLGVKFCIKCDTEIENNTRAAERNKFCNYCQDKWYREEINWLKRMMR